MFHVKHLERGLRMNRRSDKLDKFIGKNVEVTFWDGDVREGVLSFNKPYWGTNINSNKYSIRYYSDTIIGMTNLFFRKSHVKKIREI